MYDTIRAVLGYKVQSPPAYNTNPSNATGVLYRPPGPNLDICNNISYLSDIIDNQTDVMMGDNLDILRYDIHGLTTESVDDMISHSCMPLISKPACTRVQGKAVTLIDFFRSLTEFTKFTNGIHLPDLSDHYEMFTII